jgi:membrane protease YdiL (CAAX protease family)
VPTPLRTTTTIGEAATVVAICFGLFILASLQAVAAGFPVVAGAFSNASLLWLMSTELVLGAAALGLLALRGYSVASLIPRPTLSGSVWGVALFCGAWFVAWVFVAPFLSDQPTQPIDLMVQDATPSLDVVVPMALINGTFEEVFLLGFLLRGLRGHGLSFALGISLLVRVLYHLYQGPIGALSVLGIGLAFSLYYIRFAQLWPPVFAHVLFDIVAFVFGEP